jgi:hypothetical protein
VLDLADFGVESMNAPQEKQPTPGPLPTVEPTPQPAEQKPPREIGGRDGPEPTRFGDWEKAGRCIDF